MLRFITAGETHGKCLIAVVEGLPANIPVDKTRIDYYLGLRQKGYGRGGRMAIEKDTAEILTGIRDGKTMGSPVTLQIENRDYKNWESVMSPDPEVADTTLRQVHNPRPGHADLSGAIKYCQTDMRNILERASARETAARVAVGALTRQFLEAFGIRIFSHVVEIGGIKADNATLQEIISSGDIDKISAMLEQSELRCLDSEAETRMKAFIDKAKENGDSVGGIFQTVAIGMPPGVGSHVQWDRKLDARLAYAFMGIQAIKAVEIGAGVECARQPGSKVHDSIYYSADTGYYRKTNNAGGIEGGMTNGEPVVVTATMKPIPTLYSPLDTVNIMDKSPQQASVERSDICAVPAAGVVGEAAMAFELAAAFLEKFGGDSLQEIEANYRNFQQYLQKGTYL